MAKVRSDQQRLSRYAIGGETTLKGTNITWWERRVYEKSPGDVPVLLTPRHHHRPDLLAYDLYGNSLLMSFVLQYCNIIDVEEEFVQGVEIVLPTKSRLFGELLSRSV